MKKIILSILLCFSLNVFADSFDDEFEKDFIEPEENILLEKYNRGMTDVNDKLFVYFFKPISQSVEYVVPEPIRLGINNMFNNIKYPVRLTNSLLQMKFEKSYVETQRFLVNSTFGILGFMDLAKTELDLTTSPEDFGQTLAYYGVPSGPYIVLPILGPSNLRDSLCMIPDYYISPANYVEDRYYNIYGNGTEALYISSYEKFNSGSLNYKFYDMMKADAVDLYPYLKTVYTDYRKKLIEE